MPLLTHKVFVQFVAYVCLYRYSSFPRRLIIALSVQDVGSALYTPVRYLCSSQQPQPPPGTQPRRKPLLLDMTLPSWHVALWMV